MWISETQKKLISDIDDEAGFQISLKYDAKHHGTEQYQHDTQGGQSAHVAATGSRVMGDSLIGRLIRLANRPSAIVISHTVW